jgi:5-methylcytosine-specific restriction endonuclease McrA
VSKRWVPWWIRKHRDKRAKRESIRLRDGDDCWQCGKPMRFGAPFNTRRSATIEHVQAQANDGTDDLDNLRLCHKGCNRHLGTNTPEQKERMRLRRI